MVESRWEELRGKELRYRDGTWELTGDVDVRRSGASLAVEARQADDVRHGTATLHFGVDEETDSLNPGNLGVHFDRLERTADGQFLVVKTAGRTYRYELQRVEYD
ncbi:hypothetical protein [Halobacterium yunchengense]|uniref:hypothetical protein n=1 Tax=Halobacterium yunchengense TaxID=3108497 RepID=UPI003008305B